MCMLLNTYQYKFSYKKETYVENVGWDVSKGINIHQIKIFKKKYIIEFITLSQYQDTFHLKFRLIC